MWATPAPLAHNFPKRLNLTTGANGLDGCQTELCGSFVLLALQEGQGREGAMMV